MDQDDSEKRIAELERQLAAQKRIAELERQLAEAKAAAGRSHVVGQPIKVGHSVVYPGQAGTQDYNTSLGNGPPAAFAQAAGSWRQSVSRPERLRGKRAGADRAGTIIGMTGGAIGICVGGAAAITAMFPSTALWMSPIVWSPYQLAYSTSHYSYKPGQSGTSVSFQCVSGDTSYYANGFVIDALQSVLIALILGATVAAIGLLRRLLRKP